MFSLLYNKKKIKYYIMEISVVYSHSVYLSMLLGIPKWWGGGRFQAVPAGPEQQRGDICEPYEE